MLKQRGRPRLNPDARRSQILDVATRVFSESGYRASDMQGIADALGIAKGTIYLYFKSKKELFLAAVQLAIESLAGRIEKEVRMASGPLEKVKAIVGAHFSFSNENRPLAEIITQERGEFLTHAEKTYYRVFSENARHLEKILRDGIADGVFREADVEQTTGILANLLAGTIYMYILGQGRNNAGPSVDAITDFLLNGILCERKTQ